MTKKKKDNKQLAVIGILVGVIVLIVGVLLFNFVYKSNEPIIKQDQILIQKGDQTVLINENGLIEYRSDKGVFYETWSSDKTSAFFATMRAKAKAYLANPPSNIPEGAYKVYIYIDGELVEIYIDPDDEDLEEIFEEFDDSDDGEDLGDFFVDDDGSMGVPTATPAPTTTTTVSLGPSTPTPTSGAGSGGGTVQIPPDCDLYSELVTGRTVISNSICDVQQPE